MRKELKVFVFWPILKPMDARANGISMLDGVNGDAYLIVIPPCYLLVQNADHAPELTLSSWGRFT